MIDPIEWLGQPKNGPYWKWFYLGSEDRLVAWDTGEEWDGGPHHLDIVVRLLGLSADDLLEIPLHELNEHPLLKDLVFGSGHGETVHYARSGNAECDERGRELAQIAATQRAGDRKRDNRPPSLEIEQ